MIEFGNTLKSAREAKGLTISQVAESTRMMYSIVEGLEMEDFSRIVAPIYGRGFVKLYCEAVGLKPEPMIEEFMALYSGNRKKDVPPSHPSPAPATPPRPTQTDAHNFKSFQFSQQHLRLALIIIAAAVALVLLSFGIRALYRATNVQRAEVEEVEVEEVEPTVEEKETEKATPTAAPREPIAIEALYMD